MDLRTVTLNLDGARLTVQAAFGPEHCATLAQPPEGLAAQAKVLLTESGAEVVVVHEAALAEAWERMRVLAAKDGASVKGVSVTLAAGAPALPGLEVALAQTSDAVALLTITAAREVVQGWRHEWLMLQIAHRLAAAGVTKAVNEVQVHGALLRAQAGLAVKELPLAAPKDWASAERKPYHLTINRVRGEVALVVFELAAIVDEAAMKERLVRLESTVAKLRDERPGFRVLSDELHAACAALANGPAALGLGLPARLLAAIDDAPPAAAGGAGLSVIGAMSGVREPGFRTYTRKAIVRAGQTVAKAESVEGIEIGEGVKFEGGRFKATCDGVLESDGKSTIAVSKTLFHQGDVNLASGDIVFPGSVEIKGDIDAGVKLVVQGDLIVHGEIRGGAIRCSGSVKVARGIVTGKTGWIRARGDVTADFIEGSRITCRGSVTAARAILQSHVDAGVGIEVTSSTGVAAGGVLTAGKLLRAPRLGQPDGAKTEVRVGGNHRAERTVAVRTARLAALEHQGEEDRKALRAIVRKRPEQFSRADKEQKGVLKERVARWGSVIEKAKAHVAKAEVAVTYDAEATIEVAGAIAPTCHVKLAGKPMTAVKAS